MSNTESSILTDCEFLVRAINGVVWEADPKTFRFTFVSDQVQRILGFSHDECMAENFWVDHLHPDDRDIAIEACTNATVKGLDHEFEYRMIHADGTEIWIRDTIFVDMVHGEPIRLRGLLIDISEQKQLETAVRDSERLLRLIVNSSKDAIFRRRIYPDARYEFVSPAIHDITGYSPEEFYSDPGIVSKMIHPEDRRLESSNALLSPKAEATTLRLIRKDGATVWVEILSVAIFDDSGDPIAVEGIVRNVTDRKKSD